VQVSSMKTRREGSTRSWYLIHCARRRATSGRSRSPATMLFFEAQLLVVDKGPDRTVVDLQTALGEFARQPEQGEVLLLDPEATCGARPRLRGACSRRSCSVERCRSCAADPPTGSPC